MITQMDTSPGRFVPEAAAARIAWAAQGFSVLVAVWLIFDGPAHWPVGLFAAAAGGMLAGWLSSGPAFWWNPLRLAAFAWFFLVESFRGGIDVAWRSLHPALPVMPHPFRQPIGLPEGQPSTLLISVISLLPGTLSAELERRERILVVHTLTAGGEHAVARLKRRIARLFSLPPIERSGGR